MDIAKLSEAKKGVGMELITEFIRLYQENYIKKDKLIPIRAEAREVSSYKLITRHLNSMGESIGIEFVLEEGDSYQKGNDTMHPVTIRPIKNL
jgi:predicted ATPase